MDETPNFNVYAYQLKMLYKRVADLEQTLNQVLNEWDKNYNASSNDIYKKAKNILNHYDRVN